MVIIFVKFYRYKNIIIKYFYQFNTIIFLGINTNIIRISNYIRNIRHIFFKAGMSFCYMFYQTVRLIYFSNRKIDI